MNYLFTYLRHGNESNPGHMCNHSVTIIFYMLSYSQLNIFLLATMRTSTCLIVFTACFAALFFAPAKAAVTAPAIRSKAQWGGSAGSSGGSNRPTRAIIHHTAGAGKVTRPEAGKKCPACCSLFQLNQSVSRLLYCTSLSPSHSLYNALFFLSLYCFGFLVDRHSSSLQRRQHSSCYSGRTNGFFMSSAVH